jgi:hypothetical protein
MNVTLPNGAVIQGVPDGTPKDVIAQKAISAGLATAEDFGMTQQPIARPEIQQASIAPSAALIGMGAGGMHALQPQRAIAKELSGQHAAEAAELVKGVPGLLPTIATGAVLEPVAGVAGLAQSINPFADPGAGAKAVEAVRGLAVEPIGESAQKTGMAIAEAVAPAEEALRVPGEATLEATGSPLAATAVETAAVAIPEFIAARFGVKAAPVIRKSIESSGLKSVRAAQLGAKSNDLSIGAAKTPKELQRAAVSQDMPIPFEGESALTEGQVTRNFEQLQFEKETAKLGDIGTPLRERASNQSETLVQNLDAIADISGPVRSELRDIGRAVDEALIRREEFLSKRVSKLYESAREAGELKAPVKMDTIPEMLTDIERFEGVAANVAPIRKEALRLGVVGDEMTPNSISLDDAELFRSFVNQATDITHPQQARMRRIAISAIDDATEKGGGDIYKRARKARAEMARELENVGITKRLLSTKKGTSERAIAYEDVFKKIVLDSPRDEMNKLRGSLLKADGDGKQAWADLKAKGIEYIKESAQSLSQTDARGNPILSPDKLNRVIKSMDDKGKLESLYGKKGAQVIRDLGQISKDIFTAPPGSVNHSNTASALQVALDGFATFSFTGVPAPALTALREAGKQVKNIKTKKKIQQSLNYLKGS